ncbi:hypothetical protein ACFPRL_24770 [Pseudoclavibacter helvolus]
MVRRRRCRRLHRCRARGARLSAPQPGHPRVPWPCRRRGGRRGRRSRRARR